MIIHVTRHAQPAPYVPKPGNDPQIPPGDKDISELGTRQAQWLGERLIELGFKGMIHSSPYHRTMQTAQVVADVIDAQILPEIAIQEYVPNPGLPGGRGQTIEHIHGRYSRVVPSATMPYPWFFTGPEQQPEVQARVKPFIDRIVSEQKEDVLLVGHGATIWACMSVIIDLGEVVGEVPEAGTGWNCSLSSYEVTPDLSTRVMRLFDVSHMPDESVTSNNEYMVS